MQLDYSTLVRLMHRSSAGIHNWCVKMFPPKTRADVGMVQCVPAR